MENSQELPGGSRFQLKETKNWMKSDSQKRGELTKFLTESRKKLQEAAGQLPLLGLGLNELGLLGFEGGLNASS